jgi:hypothetical protein
MIEERGRACSIVSITAEGPAVGGVEVPEGASPCAVDSRVER